MITGHISISKGRAARNRNIEKREEKLLIREPFPPSPIDRERAAALRFARVGDVAAGRTAIT